MQIMTSVYSCGVHPRSYKSIFSPIALPGTEHNSLKVSANRPRRLKIQSCPNWLKLNIQSLLFLLIIKIPILSILSQNCGSLSSNRATIMYHENIKAQLLHKLPQFWLKIDKIGIFIIRRNRRLWIFNLSQFGQL